MLFTLHMRYTNLNGRVCVFIIRVHTHTNFKLSSSSSLLLCEKIRLRMFWQKQKERQTHEDSSAKNARRVLLSFCFHFIAKFSPFPSSLFASFHINFHYYHFYLIDAHTHIYICIYTYASVPSKLRGSKGDASGPPLVQACRNSKMFRMSLAFCQAQSS